MKITSLLISLPLMSSVLLTKSHADIVVDDFNAVRSYPYCCGEFGTYDSFYNSATQSGAGTLVINAMNTDGGGVYHFGLGTKLWDFTGQTGLVVRAKALTNNTAGSFLIEFQDLQLKRMFFQFPFSSLNTTNFTTLTAEITKPDFYDDGFNVSKIGSFDIQADYGDFFFPTFGLELDYVKSLDPSNSTAGILVSIAVSAATNAVISWPTNVPANMVLQYSTNLNYPWTNYTGTPFVWGTNYTVTQSMLGDARFFQLGSAAIQNSKYHLESGGYGDYAEGVSPDTNAIPKTMENFAAAPLYTNTTIDVSTYSKEKQNWIFRWNGSYGGSGPFYSEGYDLSTWSDHTGGTDKYGFKTHHMTTVGTYPCWNTQCDAWNSNTINWVRGDTNWPKGWIVHTINSNCFAIGHDYSQQYPERAGTPYFHVNNVELGIGDFTNLCSRGDTNWLKWSENTTLDMHAVSAKGVQWILLSAAAVEVELYYFGSGFGINYAPYNVFPTNISLLGKPLNADEMLFQKYIDADYPVTPLIIGATNYQYDVEIVPHKKVGLTWLYHQRFHTAGQTVPLLSTWQQRYDQGSRLLATDDDAKIADDDPSVAPNTNAASLYFNDDVPVYVEFVLTNGPTNLCVFTKDLRPVISLTNDATFHVKFQSGLEQLHAQPGNLILVKDITLNETNVIIGEAGGIGPMPPSIVISEAADPGTLIHEWGHSCGIYHRNTLNGLLNRSLDDTNAIMHKYFYPGSNKINRPEKQIMEL